VHIATVHATSPVHRASSRRACRQHRPRQYHIRRSHQHVFIQHQKGTARQWSTS